MAGKRRVRRENCHERTARRNCKKLTTEDTENGKRTQREILQFAGLGKCVEAGFGFRAEV